MLDVICSCLSCLSLYMEFATNMWYTANMNNRKEGAKMVEEKNIQFLNVRQIAKILQVNPSTVTKWLRDGTMRGYKSGKQWRILEQDFYEWLENNVNQKEE